MATITRRGDFQWQAKVRRKGYPTQTRTFDYRADAEKWARSLERDFETTGLVDRREAERNTLRAILERYEREVTPRKKSAEIEKVKIRVILRDPVLPNLKMAALTSSHVAAFRDRRLQSVTGSTVNRELTVLSSAINHARREWGVEMSNPLELVKRAENNKPRDRRFSDEEMKYLLAALRPTKRRDDGTFAPGARNIWVESLLRLAVETAMRRGELLDLHWKNVDLKARSAHLPDTKNGTARTVPLSTKAVAILKALPRSFSGDVFPTSRAALRACFVRALERARKNYIEDCTARKGKPDASFLRDVHFHDTRHEAASRMAERLSNILELSAVTGHKDLRMLKRYYHPRTSDLAKKLG